ncbi:MAG: T9SS type A sorting domain-containing protein [Bacteroidales bacterium]|nr:T9SS type A sorting domain-containing protein [Bacteroidales bacterium]
MGGLYIDNNRSLANLAGLETLTLIDGNLDIQNNENLVSLAGIDNLGEGSIDNLIIQNNSSLSKCSILGLCNYLSNPNGTVSVYNNAEGCNDPPQIAAGCGIPMTCLPYGNYYFFNQNDIDEFQADYPDCTDLQGDVIISGIDILNLNGLSTIQSIGGNLNITENNVLSNLNGLDSISFIGGDLQVSDNDSLPDMSGMGGLSFVGGNIFIGYNYSLSSIAGFDNLTSVNEGLSIYTNSITSLSGPGNLQSVGYLNISDNPDLLSLDGLENLTDVGAGLTIRNNSSLISLDGIGNVSDLNGSMNIYSNEALVSLTEMEHLTRVAGDVLITENSSLENLSGLENLSEIDGNLDLSNNTLLENLNGLLGLTMINGNLRISGEYSLPDLQGLNNLTSIEGDITINWNSVLSSLAGLENLNSIGGLLEIISNNGLTNLEGINSINGSSIQDLYISYNYSLSTCHVQSICDYLADPKGYVEIIGNSGSCATREEVEAACVVGLDEEAQEAYDQFTICPNPATGHFLIETSRPLSGNTTFSLYNMNGQEVMHRKMTNPVTGVDASRLPRGVYVLKVLENADVHAVKLVIQ